MGDRGMSWRYVWASTIGTGHRELGLPCQDRCIVQLQQGTNEPEVLVIAVADGAGSAAQAERGAYLVTETLLGCAQRALQNGLRVPEVTRDIARAWITEVVAAIREQAALAGIPARDYAATALLTLATPQAAACVQVGDGVQVVHLDDRYEVAIWPQNGEYASSTVFACDEDAIEAADVRVLVGRIQDVAAMTDGVQSLAIHYASRTAHGPFFNALLPSVRQASPGEDERLNRALADFLDTRQVNERTNDDKTLVLASLG